MKCCIVTGAGGFIGSRLSALLAETSTVYALVHNERGAAGLSSLPNLIPVVGDLNEWEKIYERLPSDGSVDCFYHLAWGGISSTAYRDIDVQQSNIVMSVNAAKLAKGIKCGRFVFVGTNQEYLLSPNSLDGSLCSASVYGVCKKSARELCHVLLKDKMLFNATAFTNVFGPGDFSKRTANLFIGKLLRGESLDLIEGNILYDWTFVDDAVDGLISVGEHGKNGKQYYIGSRQMLTFRDILMEVRDTLCPEAELRFGRYYDPTWTDYSRFDLDALYNDTGFECHADFRESILRTAAWVKENL